MKLFRVFLEHELITQWRSMRFRGLAAVYIVAGCATSVILYFMEGRTSRGFGPGTYNGFLLSEQPLLTALFAVGLAVDAIARERDEGSFAVLSVAPISSVGYVLRRWLAIVVICICVSLVPTAITAAIAVHTRQTLPLLPIFFAGWLVWVLPSLLVSSALAMALGTITGRTVLAIIFGALLITAGIGIMDSLLFYVRIDFAGPSDLFTGGDRAIQELIWTLKGYWFPRVPTDAAFPLRNEARAMLSRAGITSAMTIALLALSVFYLRRTKRDLRPWRIRETHPIRTMLRTANRIREEYMPDSGGGTLDRVVLAIALVLAALVVAYLLRRQSAFTALGDARYAYEGQQGVPTSLGVVAESVRIDGDVTLGGEVRSRSTSIIRNDGTQPETHLSFMLHPMMSVRRLAIDRGTARMHRAWERLDLDLDPPLAPRERRTLSVDLTGTPAEIDFELQPPGNFASRWHRRRTAQQAIYMTDMSRSTVAPAATEVRMRLRGSDLVPVIRYSAWTLQQPELPENDEKLTAEAVMPPVSLQVHFVHPYPLAVDGCGTMTARREMVSRCTTGLASYALFGGPLAQRAIGANATLAYIPAHEQLAITQSHALAAAIRLATEAWPGLDVPPHVTFIERPAETNDRNWFFEYAPWLLVEGMGSRGAVFLIPESAFTTRRTISPNQFAASITGDVLRAKRRVVAKQAPFFASFYTTAAAARLGMRKSGAVEPGGGMFPDTWPLLGASYGPRSRMAKVLTALEYRVGADHFIEGINDFVNAAGGRPGTAKELVDAIGRRAGIDLSRTYDDYFEGSALPKLTLTDVVFHRAGAEWEVTGAVKNTGTGEAFVPVALRTAQGSHWQTVRVDSGGSARFSFSAPGEPRSVQLDPDGVCYRHAVIGLVENVEYRGQS